MKRIVGLMLVLAFFDAACELWVGVLSGWIGVDERPVNG